MEIYFYNTLTGKKEQFVPIDKEEVKMYSCGPTVYSYAHIGNFRTYVFVDSLRRTLEYNGYKMRHVMNITDVGHLTSDADTGEDKMEKAARKEGKDPYEIAKFYTEAFMNDMAKLNIEKALFNSPNSSTISLVFSIIFQIALLIDIVKPNIKMTSPIVMR